ncbi:MAG: ABC transporter permease [Clostridia bacterium]|nr:ABC transporter permease [Clostridia bacterium]
MELKRKPADDTRIKVGKKSGSVMTLPLIIWLVCFVLVPLLLIGWYGITVENPDGSMSVSFENFKRFADPIYLNPLLRSAKIATITTVVCIALGYPVAYILARSTAKWTNIVMMLILMPMWINFMLRIYSWASLLEGNGIINSLLVSLGFEKQQFMYTEGVVVLGTIYNFLPFMIMPIQNVLLKLDNSLLEAAADLGASPVRRFFKITLPYSVPGIISGVAMVFVPSVTTFVISQRLGGNKVPLIGNIIESQFGMAGDWNFGSTVSLIVMAIVLAFMFAINKTDRAEVNGRGLTL